MLQDVACTRCRVVSRGGMAAACGGCGGELALTAAAGAARREAAVLCSIATFHGLSMLREEARWYLER
jgi:hypothetical protein